jgi:hypothetical protein
MAAVPPTGLNAEATRVEIEIVVNDDHLAEVEAEFADQRGDDRPAAVHVGLRLDQRDRPPGQVSRGPEDFAMPPEPHPGLGRHGCRDPKAHIVTGFGVGRTRVAETDY